MDIRVKLLGNKLWAKSRKPLRVFGLITAGLIAAYISSLQSREHEFGGIASSRATGMAAEYQEATDPLGLWHQMSILPHSPAVAMLQKGVAQRVVAEPATVALQNDQLESSDRKMVRTASLNLLVKAPAQSLDRIVQLAQNAGGFVVTSQVYGGADALNASLAIRVPTKKFDEVRTQILALALHVDGENTDAQDVTRQYVDEDARLRNLRAQEQQYLGILRKAATVKDTLEVSEKINDVRQEIEEKQAEFEALSKQVATVAINIALRAEADEQVFGLHWRPLYQLKFAAREGLDGLGSYVASMTSVVFFLPTFLLWLMTILVGSAIVWRILRWAARILFHAQKTNAPAV
jgi:Domain of unknown function (DUF4349)